MIKSILVRVWNNPKETVKILVQEIAENYVTENKVCDINNEKLKREKERLNIRLNTLLDMRLDNQIDIDSYNIKQKELNSKIKEIEEALEESVKVNVIESEEDVSETI